MTLTELLQSTFEAIRNMSRIEQAAILVVLVGAVGGWIQGVRFFLVWTKRSLTSFPSYVRKVFWNIVLGLYWWFQKPSVTLLAEPHFSSILTSDRNNRSEMRFQLIFKSRSDWPANVLLGEFRVEALQNRDLFRTSRSLLRQGRRTPYNVNSVELQGKGSEKTVEIRLTGRVDADYFGFDAYAFDKTKRVNIHFENLSTSMPIRGRYEGGINKGL